MPSPPPTIWARAVSYILFQQLTFPVSTYYLLILCPAPLPQICFSSVKKKNNSKYSSKMFIALQNKRAEVIKRASGTVESSAALWKSRSLYQCQTRFHFSVVQVVISYEWSSWWFWTRWHRPQECLIGGKKKSRKGVAFAKRVKPRWLLGICNLQARHSFSGLLWSGGQGEEGCCTFFSSSSLIVIEWLLHFLAVKPLIIMKSL